MDIVVLIARSTGPAKPSGIEANATRKIFAAISATTVPNVKRAGKRNKKRNKNRFTSRSDLARLGKV